MSKCSLMPVKFHGANLVLVSIDNQPYVALKPICEALTISWQAQLERIKRNPVLSKGIRVTRTPSNGGNQEMICLPLSMLNGWLFGINANRVKNSEIRQKLIEYQFECYDALNNYWNGKTASRDPMIADVVTHDDMMSIASLCTHMRFLDGWWHQYGPAIRILNRRIAASIHDHFSDGAFRAGGLVNRYRLGITTLDFTRQFPFSGDFAEQSEYYKSHDRYRFAK